MYMFAYIATVFGSRETNITPPDSAHPALCLVEASDEEVMKFFKGLKNSVVQDIRYMGWTPV